MKPGEQPRSRLHILYVARHVPYVPSHGAITRTFHLVRAVSEIADVTLVGTLYASGNKARGTADTFCETAHVLQAPPGIVPGPLTRVMRAVRALESRYRVAQPLGVLAGWLRRKGGRARLVRRLDPSGVRAAVRRLLQSQPYDMVIVEHTEIAETLLDVLDDWNGPRVADLHNVMSVLAAQTGGVLLESERGTVDELRAAERRILQSYTRVIAVSQVDVDRLRQIVPAACPDLIPNGVDVAYFEEVGTMRGTFTDARTQADTLIFTGLLSYAPNVDAIRFFVGDILPLIRTHRPEVRLLIVGAAPVAEEVQSLETTDGVELFASVDDVRPFMARSHVAVVPVRLGSGTRLKVLEALAAHLPVVSTTLGAEGLDLTPNRDILIADDSPGFANAVVTLLEDRSFGERLAGRGAEAVRRQYDWNRIGNDVRTLVRQVVETEKTGEGRRDCRHGTDATRSHAL